MTLFELDARIRNFLDNLYATVDEDGTVEADFDQLAALNAERDVKVENIALYIKELEVQAGALKAEKAKLDARIKATENKAERLRKYLADSLWAENAERLATAKDKTVFETARCKLSFRKSVSVNILDEAAVPKKYKVIKREEKVDTKAIRAQLDAGKAVKGAELKTSQNLQIK